MNWHHKPKNGWTPETEPEEKRQILVVYGEDNKVMLGQYVASGWWFIRETDDYHRPAWLRYFCDVHSFTYVDEILPKGD